MLPAKSIYPEMVKEKMAKSLIVAKVTEMSTMRLINSNPGNLMTNLEREMGRKARTP